MGMGERSLAPRTSKRYRACVALFCTVTGPWEERVSSLESRIQSFIVWAKDEVKSHSWVTSHLAAISHHMKLLGQEDPTKSFLIRAALKGWARCEPRQPDTRSPIDFETLQGLLDWVPRVTHSAYEATLFAATFSLAFFGAFRISELVARSKLDSSGTALNRKDASLAGNTLTVVLRRSKTD